MNNLQVINQNGLRVLTTAQLAESYGTDKQQIVNNFNRNKDRYMEAKHYFALQGVEKNQFIDLNQIELGSKKAQTLYLWTERGAWLHAKSLNTDEAWNAYEMLVDEYYNIKQNVIDTSQLSPELQMFSQIFNTLANSQIEQNRLCKEIEETKQQVHNISEIVALNTIDWRKETTEIINKIARKTGEHGLYQQIRKESYKLLEERANCNLQIRLVNKQKKMALEGVVKSRIDKVSKLDVINEDKRLLEIYLAVVKEMAIKYKVQVNTAS
ncbi:ORF6N domain-containing protein [Gottfriedia sp. NPDC056225]|uniref:ORF6N domain-containing protein n=1 Tax=Gottfriedia sp. NPDC056225 TaxID=3345751 RepID=UPI0035DF6FF3